MNAEHTQEMERRITDQLELVGRYQKIALKYSEPDTKLDPQTMSEIRVALQSGVDKLATLSHLLYPDPA